MILEAKNISKKFPRKLSGANFFFAVNPMDFTLNQGEIVEIIGRSGSGKTTLLNMLSGLLNPSDGKVLADGKSIYDLQDKELSKFRNEHFGVVPQGHTGIENLTVLENVLLPSLLYGNDYNVQERALELLQKLNISHLKDAYPNELSGGEVRRLAIARALIMKPAFLFADEPTGDLDDENTQLVLEMLRELANLGTGVLLVTHENEAQKYADKIYKMNSGNIEA